MSLRSRTLEETAHLPDGREVVIRVGVPEDSYIPRKEMTTVDAELWEGRTLLGVVNTVLSPEQESEGLHLARELKSRLEAGELAPTAQGLEAVADDPRWLASSTV